MNSEWATARSVKPYCPYSLPRFSSCAGVNRLKLKYSGSTTHVFVLVASKRIWSGSDSFYSPHVLLFPCRPGPYFGRLEPHTESFWYNNPCCDGIRACWHAHASKQVYSMVKILLHEDSGVNTASTHTTLSHYEDLVVKNMNTQYSTLHHYMTTQLSLLHDYMSTH